MRSEDEIREQYEFLQEQLESDEMRHEGVRQMFTYYKRRWGGPSTRSTCEVSLLTGQRTVGARGTASGSDSDGCPFSSYA
jgi:hypothetical protein